MPFLPVEKLNRANAPAAEDQCSLDHWTNTFCPLDKYIYHFDKYISILTNTFVNLDKYIRQLGQIHFEQCHVFQLNCSIVQMPKTSAASSILHLLQLKLGFKPTLPWCTPLPILNLLCAVCIAHWEADNIHFLPCWGKKSRTESDVF